MDIALRGGSVDFSGSDRCTMQLGMWVGAKIGGLMCDLVYLEDSGNPWRVLSKGGTWAEF